MLSLNCRDLSNDKKRNIVFSWCKKQKLDILFLQETHCVKECETEWANQWGNKNAFFSNGKSNARGTMVLLRKGFEILKEKLITDSQGRHIIFKAKIQETPFYLINLYAPNNDKEELIDFYSKVKTIIENEGINALNNIIIGGYFNCPLDPLLDKFGSLSNLRTPVVDKINELITSFELKDIWRLKNPNKRCYTWRHASKLLMSRIDLWLTCIELQDNIDKTRYPNRSCRNFSFHTKQ